MLQETSHVHDEHCCSSHDHNHHDHLEMISLEGKSRESLINDLFGAVRYGFQAHVQTILEENKDLVDVLDSQGYSCAHWAAKRGDIAVLQILANFGADFGIKTTSDSGMMPIHWAASDGKILAIKLLLEHRQDINGQDNTGCTPLIIASQHNQISTVIYLMKNGADLTLRDNCQDSALHWAAYKGYTELVPLLANFMPMTMDQCDIYGQTPLHLASLRGNTDCVEYLVAVCHADVYIRDKNGLTPLDLALSKNQFITEWVLRRLIYKGVISFIQSLGSSRIFLPRTLQYLIFGCRDQDYAVWAWRVVFLSNFIGSIITIFYTMSAVLSDLYMLHQLNTMLQFLWWIFFILCLLKSPGYVRDAAEDSRYSYAAGLQEIADVGIVASKLGDLAFENLPNLCHTCRVRRPLRSKHCRVLKKCVHKFDHFCPFVGNTVGRDNYKYFVGLLTMHLICGVLWIVTTIFYLRRAFSWYLAIFACYSAFWMVIVFSLWSYHIKLIALNLSTNEHANLPKYAYLKDGMNLYDNPFDKKNFWLNFYDSMFPSEECYYSRESIKYQ